MPANFARYLWCVQEQFIKCTVALCLLRCILCLIDLPRHLFWGMGPGGYICHTPLLEVNLQYQGLPHPTRLYLLSVLPFVEFAFAIFWFIGMPFVGFCHTHHYCASVRMRKRGIR